jgi:hypothetical protein
MSAIASRPSRTWAATHRVLLAAIAFAVAVAATVVIVLMTTAGSSGVQAPGQGQTHTQNQLPTGAQNQGQPDTQPRCLQYMGLQYMGVRPC